MSKVVEIGSDFSRYQYGIDIPKLKKEGISFAILRAGGYEKGYYKDPLFEEFYKKCKENGIKVGAYFISSHNRPEEAIEDSIYFKNIIGKKQFEYPLYIDMELQPYADKKDNSVYAYIFCSEMESSGYYAGIYSNTDWFRNVLNTDLLKRFDKWVAAYNNGSEPPFTTAINGHIWQYTNQLLGMNLDGNRSYCNYESIIKNNKLNNFK